MTASIPQYLQERCAELLPRHAVDWDRMAVDWDRMAWIMSACRDVVDKPVEWLSPAMIGLYVAGGSLVAYFFTAYAAFETIKTNTKLAAVQQATNQESEEKRAALDREIAAKRATLDAINAGETAIPYRVGRAVFQHYATHDPRALAMLAVIGDRDQRGPAIDYINYFEGIAAGVHEGILSRDHVDRTLGGLMFGKWGQAVFFIYQLRWQRELETRLLLIDVNTGKPIPRERDLIEFQTLVGAVDMPKQLLPDPKGEWAITKDDLRDDAVLVALRIKPPAKDAPDADRDAFEELLNDLVKLTKPMEPKDLQEIAGHPAWPPHVDTSVKVMPEPKCVDDVQIEGIETILSEIRAAMAEMRDLAREAGKRSRADRRRSR